MEVGALQPTTVAKHSVSKLDEPYLPKGSDFLGTNGNNANIYPIGY